jgi:hypothetical protein
MISSLELNCTELQTLPDYAVICPNHMHRPQPQNEYRNSSCHDKPCPWTEQNSCTGKINTNLIVNENGDEREIRSSEPLQNVAKV